jgi:hypothetical protein
MAKHTILIEVSFDEDEHKRGMGDDGPLSPENMRERVEDYLKHSDPGVFDDYWFPGVEVESVKLVEG